MSEAKRDESDLSALSCEIELNGNYFDDCNLLMAKIDKLQQFARLFAECPCCYKTGNNMKTQFKKLHEDAVIPTRATEGSAGFDLYAINTFSILPKAQVKIPTGIACAIPENNAGFIWPRSSLAVKHGVNKHAGLVDSDYRGEIHVCLINHGKDIIDIRKGDRIAQMVIQPVVLDSEEVTELDDPQTRTGGFGSTGV